MTKSVLNESILLYFPPLCIYLDMVQIWHFQTIFSKSRSFFIPPCNPKNPILIPEKMLWGTLGPGNLGIGVGIDIFKPLDIQKEFCGTAK